MKFLQGILRSELRWNFSSTPKDVSDIYRFPALHMAETSCRKICEYQNLLKISQMSRGIISIKRLMLTL